MQVEICIQGTSTSLSEDGIKVLQRPGEILPKHARMLHASSMPKFGSCYIEHHSQFDDVTVRCHRPNPKLICRPSGCSGNEPPETTSKQPAGGFHFPADKCLNIHQLILHPWSCPRHVLDCPRSPRFRLRKYKMAPKASAVPEICWTFWSRSWTLELSPPWSGSPQVTMVPFSKMAAKARFVPETGLGLRSLPPHSLPPGHHASIGQDGWKSRLCAANLLNISESWTLELSPPYFAWP